MDKLVLVIEDEAPIVEILKFNLGKSGYRVLAAYDGEEGYRLALSEKPDLILLDVMLPKMDGFEVCKKIREKQSTPIIMLTARDEEVDKVLGFELGADDYCTKPFSVRELMARVKANIRRTSADAPQSESSDLITFQNLSINPARYEVSKDDAVIDLTLREFELLKFLAQQPGKIFTRETLLEKVWGYEYFGDVRTVDVTVRRLREKVEDNPASPNFIMTKRGVGYYFNK
ncbi:MAG: response regulator transcription factor [Clostridia bacterium]|nr:response regulator transcription factor [Clostridia bacterium]